MVILQGKPEMPPPFTHSLILLFTQSERERLEITGVDSYTTDMLAVT